MIDAKIILDSLNEVNGKRLTTWVVTFNRFVLAEVNTHRAFSRNSASSRAIPIKKMLDAVRTNPAMPIFWGKNEPGMKAKEELDDIIKRPRPVIDQCYIQQAKLVDTTGDDQIIYELTDREYAKQVWLEARDEAVKQVIKLNELGLHKQVGNRVIESWMWQTAIISATDFGNFMALRAHGDAQPEFGALAYKMLDVYNKSIPTILKFGEWHIPFGDKMPDGADLTLKLKIATARCARVSYLTFDNEMNVEKDLKIHDDLSSSGHWSPFEHSACATVNGTGNFKGWTQYRALFPNENRTDDRIKPKTVKNCSDYDAEDELTVEGTLSAMKILVDNFTPLGYTVKSST